MQRVEEHGGDIDQFGGEPVRLRQLGARRQVVAAPDRERPEPAGLAGRGQALLGGRGGDPVGAVVGQRRAAGPATQVGGLADDRCRPGAEAHRGEQAVRRRVAAAGVVPVEGEPGVTQRVVEPRMRRQLGVQPREPGQHPLVDRVDEQ